MMYFINSNSLHPTKHIDKYVKLVINSLQLTVSKVFVVKRLSLTHYKLQV